MLINEHLSELQMANDEVGFLYVTKMMDIKLYSALQDYCSFSVLNGIGELGWYKDVAKFVCLNGKELKRKLTLKEFLELARKYRIVSAVKTVKTFKDIKNVKIKPYARHKGM